MKTKLKHIAILVFVMTIFTSTFAQEPGTVYEHSSISIYDSTYKCVGGVYYTYDDFLKNNITDLGMLLTTMRTPNYNGVAEKVHEIDFVKPDSLMIMSASPTMEYFQNPQLHRQQKFTFNFKDDKIWGFRTPSGCTYRVNKADHAAYILIMAGPYCLWGDHTTLTSYDTNGNVYRVDITYAEDLHDRFSKHLFISKNLNGELFNCNNKFLENFFKEDEEILADLKKNPIKESDPKKVKSCLSNVIKWVEIYNAKHKI